MDYCAKRWQTREGTYQLKRRRLLPNVRDLPEQEDAEVDMKDIWSLDGWHGWPVHGGRDAMRGWEGRDLFHLFCGFSLAGFVGVELCCACLFVCFVLVLPVKILHSITVSLLLRISSSWPTMSRARSAMHWKKNKCCLLSMLGDIRESLALLYVGLFLPESVGTARGVVVLYEKEMRAIRVSFETRLH